LPKTIHLDLQDFLQTPFMVNYRRIWSHAGFYFFTLTLHNRKKTYLTDYIDILRIAFQSTIDKYPVKIEAICVLPDHLHTIIYMPEEYTNYSKLFQIIKSKFTIRIPIQKPIWQPRFWEHLIRNEKDLNNHINYIHYNPVKHCLVKNVADWQYSSFHQYVRHRKLEIDWGCSYSEPKISKYCE